MQRGSAVSQQEKPAVGWEGVLVSPPTFRHPGWHLPEQILSDVYIVERMEGLGHS